MALTHAVLQCVWLHRWYLASGLEDAFQPGRRSPVQHAKGGSTAEHATGRAVFMLVQGDLGFAGLTCWAVPGTTLGGHSVLDQQEHLLVPLRVLQRGW